MKGEADVDPCRQACHSALKNTNTNHHTKPKEKEFGIPTYPLTAFPTHISLVSGGPHQCPPAPCWQLRALLDTSGDVPIPHISSQFDFEVFDGAWELCQGHLGSLFLCFGVEVSRVIVDTLFDSCMMEGTTEHNLVTFKSNCPNTGFVKR